MKQFLKKYLQYTSIHHYLAVLRRQPAHMQHVYAITFAGSITAVLAAVILYVDYGFWHDTYRRDDLIEVKTENSVNITTQSPAEMIGSFFKEAGIKLKSINTDGTELLNGREEFKRQE